LVEGGREIPRVGWRLVIQLDGRGWCEGLRLNQDALLGAILRDPDNRGIAGSDSASSYGHWGIRRQRQERREQEGDGPLVHSIFSIATSRMCGVRALARCVHTRVNVWDLCRDESRHGTHECVRHSFSASPSSIASRSR
jgi:hypothetical protein